MGRRPEIHHSQLQGQQRQPDDVPQEAVSFACMSLCAWRLPSKCRLGDAGCIYAPGSFPSVLLTLEKLLARTHQSPSCHLADMCDAHSQTLFEGNGWWQEGTGTPPPQRPLGCGPGLLCPQAADSSFVCLVP